jgi:FlaA1/EpsC-like NDP-sugar epimerase
MKIKDLIEIFAEKYSKDMEISGLRPGEKLHEALLNENEMFRVSETDDHYIIRAPFRQNTSESVFRYDSSIPLIDKDNLTEYLIEKGYL